MNIKNRRGFLSIITAAVIAVSLCHHDSVYSSVETAVRRTLDTVCVVGHFVCWETS